MSTINLTEDGHAALTAAIRRLIEEDKFPNAPRLDRYALLARSSGAAEATAAYRTSWPSSPLRRPRPLRHPPRPHGELMAFRRHRLSDGPKGVFPAPRKSDHIANSL